MNIEPGHYRTRNGRKVRILGIWPELPEPVIGILYGENQPSSWFLDGKYHDYTDSDEDLIEEWTEPKKPRIMSPAIVEYSDGTIFITDRVYESEEDAKSSIAADIFHSWPARDANGNPITYLVPEGE